MNPSSLSLWYLFAGAVRRPQKETRRALRELSLSWRLLGHFPRCVYVTCMHAVRSAGELPAETQRPGFSVRVLAELQQGAGLPVGPAGQNHTERLD